MSAKKYVKDLIKRYSKRFSGKSLKNEVISHLKALMSLTIGVYEKYYYYHTALTYAKKKL